MRTIRVELTREEALAVLDGLKSRSSERLIMSAGAKLLVAVDEEGRGHGRGEPACCRTGCGRLGVEQSGDGIRWYCSRHWKEAINEGDPSR